MILMSLRLRARRQQRPSSLGRLVQTRCRLERRPARFGSDPRARNVPLAQEQSTGRLACASDTYTLIITRLDYVDKVIRWELRQPPEMEVSQVRIPFFRYPASLFPRPADRHQRPSHSVLLLMSTKLSHQVFCHLILIQGRPLEKMIAKCGHHWWRDTGG